MQFLKKIIEPILVENFLTNYWNKTFLKVEGNSDKFTGILSLEKFQKVLQDNSHFLSFPQVTLFQNGAMLNETKYSKKWKLRISGTLGFQEKTSIDLSKLNSIVESNITIKVSQFENICPYLSELLSNFSNEIIPEEIYVNAFYSTPCSHAFNPHFDEHDVFILQLHGEKMWEIFHFFQDGPMQEYRGPLNDGYLTAPKIEIKLKQGEFLYVPRGMWHNVYSTSKSSLHLTIGIRAKTLIDLLYWMQEKLIQKSEFRKSFKIGHKLDDEMKFLILNSIKDIIDDNKLITSFFETTRSHISEKTELAL